MWYGCSTTSITSSWKVPNTEPKTYNNILVVAVSKDVPLRQQIEESFVVQLQNLGYQSGSAMEEYGPYGLGKFSKEQTYATLCNNGYDAVLTIVLIDKEKEKKTGQKGRQFSNNYYYNRILNYSRLQADIKDNTNKLYWEAVLFDLHTLETRYKVQTKAVTAAELILSVPVQEKAIVRNMLKKKVLIKRVAVLSKAATF
jgi:hypothetical protein